VARRRLGAREGRRIFEIEEGCVLLLYGSVVFGRFWNWVCTVLFDQGGRYHGRVLAIKIEEWVSLLKYSVQMLSEAVTFNTSPTKELQHMIMEAPFRTINTNSHQIDRGARK